MINCMESSKQILEFNKINDRVVTLIGHQPILRITNFKLYNGSFIVVTDFDIVKVLESSVATPDYLTDKETFLRCQL